MQSLTIISSISNRQSDPCGESCASQLLDATVKANGISYLLMEGLRLCVCVCVVWVND